MKRVFKHVILLSILFFSQAAMAAPDYPMNLRINYYDAELVQLEWQIKTLNLIRTGFKTSFWLRPAARTGLIVALHR